MDLKDIVCWNELPFCFELHDEFTWDTLLLGNGASIAIHGAFRFESLHSIAEERGLLPTTESIFTKLGTTDFEHVLLACWYAEQVNVALGTPSADISEAYEEVRTALIRTVHSVHPRHADVVEDLRRVGTFASAFKTVVSLNYDLIFYWAMLLFNEENGNWFKDAFLNGAFETNWERLREPFGDVKGATLVFYPHGNLFLARDYLGEEEKIEASFTEAGNLLETITEKWSSGHYVPVFVSEGTSEVKVAAIRRSRYLTHVYEKVLPKIGENLVVYGWNFNKRDQHVLEAIQANPPKRMAVSVFTGQSEEDQLVFCYRVLKAVQRYLNGTEVVFFDSQSPGCWNNPR